MFGQSIGKAFHFASNSGTEALNRLLYVAEQGEPFVLLTGEHGIGKTSLLRQFQQECQKVSRSTLLINVSALDERSLLSHLCGGLSIGLSGSEDSGTMMAAIRDELQGRALCQHQTIVVLDDIHRSREDLAAVINFLTSINQQTSGAVTVVATAEETRNRSLERLSAFRVQLPQLDNSEAAEFMHEFLLWLGVSTQQLPDQRASAAIADMAEGNVAILRRFCEVISVAVATHPDLTVTAELVEMLSAETLLSRAG